MPLFLVGFRRRINTAELNQTNPLSLSDYLYLFLLCPSFPSSLLPSSLKLAGAAILGVGVWTAVDSTSFLGVLDSVQGIPEELSQLIYVSYLLIALGSVLLIIGFLGCCGAIRESRCMLLTVRGSCFCRFLVSCRWVVIFIRTLTTSRSLQCLDCR